MQYGPVPKIIPTKIGQVGANGSGADVRIIPNWLKPENLDKAIRIVHLGNEEIAAVFSKYKDKKDNLKNTMLCSQELTCIHNKINTNLDKL